MTIFRFRAANLFSGTRLVNDNEVLGGISGRSPPDPDRTGVGMKTLGLCDSLDGVTDTLEAFPADQLHGGALAEVLYIEARVEAGIPRSGEDMVGP